MRKTKALWPLAVMLFLYTAIDAQSYTGRLGVEAPDDVFIDIVKKDYRWNKPNGAGGWAALT